MDPDSSKPAAAVSLCPVLPGSLHAYKLQRDHIVGFFLGILPWRKIPLKEVRYLRLATLQEVPMRYRIFNWQLFHSRERSTRPVYILKTRKRRFFLKLEGQAHFRLRQAIGRHLHSDANRRHHPRRRA